MFLCNPITALILHAMEMRHKMIKMYPSTFNVDVIWGNVRMHSVTFFKNDFCMHTKGIWSSKRKHSHTHWKGERSLNMYLNQFIWCCMLRWSLLFSSYFYFRRCYRFTQSRSADLFHHQHHHHSHHCHHHHRCLDNQIVTVNGVSQLFATLLSHLFELVSFSNVRFFLPFLRPLLVLVSVSETGTHLHITMWAEKTAFGVLS